MSKALQTVKHERIRISTIKLEEKNNAPKKNFKRHLECTANQKHLKTIARHDLFMLVNRTSTSKYTTQKSNSKLLSI